MNNKTQEEAKCAARFLLGEWYIPDDFFDHVKILIAGFLRQVLLKFVQKGCCSKAGPGYQCGHCEESLRVLHISRAIILSLHKLPSELHASKELITLCSLVREKVINFRIKSGNEIKSILPDKMSKLILGCTSITTAKPSLDQWGDDIARLVQPISPHWSIRVKLLMHMGYRVTLVDFDDVAIFARKDLSAVCSDVSQLLCPAKGGDIIIPQYNPAAKECPLHNQKLSYSELSTELKNAQDIIKQKDQIIHEKNALLAEQMAVIERVKSIQIQDIIFNSTKGGDDISPPPAAKERPLDKETKQKLEQIMNELNSGETELTSKPLPTDTDTKSSSLVIDEQIQPNESNGGQPVDSKMPDIDEPDDGFVIRIPSQPTSGEAGIRQLKPEVTKEDAKLYLDKVKLESPPNIYNGFLKIMKDLQEKKIDTIGTINRVRRLFHENNDMDLGWNNNMVLGFNRFLPNGYSIEKKTGDTESVFIGASPRLSDTSIKDMEETQQKVELAIESKVSIKDRKSDTDYNAKHKNGSPPQALNDTDEPDDDFVIRTPSSGGAPIGPKPELKREDAILYINQVKLEFKDRPHIYDEFLKTAKDFKEQKVDEIGVINRVRRLFHGHNDLILGFNNYLPVGYSIEMRNIGQDLPLRNTDSFNEFQETVKSIGTTLPAEEKKNDINEHQQTESESQSSTTPRGKELRTVDDSDSSSSDSDDSDYDYMNILNKPPKKGGWASGAEAEVIRNEVNMAKRAAEAVERAAEKEINMAKRAAEAAERAAKKEKDWPQLKAV